jgi:hypothetical protein
MIKVRAPFLSLLSCGFMFIFILLGCDSNKPTANPNTPQVVELKNVRLLLSSSTDHPQSLNLMIKNDSDHTIHIEECNGNPILTLCASQGAGKVELRHRAMWEVMTKGLIMAKPKDIASGLSAEYSLNIPDYLDGPEPSGNSLDHLAGFDRERPIGVWVELPNPDAVRDGRPTDVRSTVLSIELGNGVTTDSFPEISSDPVFSSDESYVDAE